MYFALKDYGLKIGIFNLDDSYIKLQINNHYYHSMLFDSCYRCYHSFLQIKYIITYRISSNK